MAEFKEVCKQWRRMCDEIQHCSAENIECCALKCVLGNNPVCGELTDATDKDLENAETVIMKWAKENPEPVYPTWSEWLYEQGVLGDKYVCSVPELIASNVATDNADDPIPADIAQKLGLQPKEGA